MYYAPSGGNVPMIAVPANQANRPIYVAGGYMYLNLIPESSLFNYIWCQILCFEL